MVRNRQWQRQLYFTSWKWHILNPDFHWNYSKTTILIRNMSKLIFIHDSQTKCVQTLPYWKSIWTKSSVQKRLTQKSTQKFKLFQNVLNSLNISQRFSFFTRHIYNYICIHLIKWQNSHLLVLYMSNEIKAYFQDSIHVVLKSLILEWCSIVHLANAYVASPMTNCFVTKCQTSYWLSIINTDTQRLCLQSRFLENQRWLTNSHIENHIWALKISEQNFMHTNFHLSLNLFGLHKKGKFRKCSEGWQKTLWHIF